MTEPYEFASDTHRRVAGNLTQPRSAADVARILSVLDPFVDDEAYKADGVGEYLSDLAADGCVKNIGSFEDGKAAVRAISSDPDTITLAKEKAANLVAIAENPVRYPFLDTEDHWILTSRGLEALTAEAPDAPPPLEGIALKAAEDANKQLAKDDAELVKKEAARVAKGLRERADEIEKDAK